MTKKIPRDFGAHQDTQVGEAFGCQNCKKMQEVYFLALLRLQYLWLAWAHDATSFKSKMAVKCCEAKRRFRSVQPPGWHGLAFRTQQACDGLWRLVTAYEMARWCEMCFKAKGEVDCFWGMPVRLVGQSWQTEQPDHCIKHLERTCQLDLICIASPCKYWHDIHDLSLSIRSEPAACDDMWWPASILRRLAQHKVSIWKLMLELALNTVSQYHYYAESTSQVRVF